MDFLLYILIVLLVIRLLTKNLHANIRRREELIAKIQSIPLYNVDEYNNILYVYEDDKTFVTQGNTLEEIAQDVWNRLNVQIAVVVHKSNSMMFIKGKIIQSTKV